MSDNGESASVTEPKSTNSLPGNNVNNCVEELTGLVPDVYMVPDEYSSGLSSTLLATGHATTAYDRLDSWTAGCGAWLVYPLTDFDPEGVLHSDCPPSSRD